MERETQTKKKAVEIKEMPAGIHLGDAGVAEQRQNAGIHGEQFLDDRRMEGIITIFVRIIKILEKAKERRFSLFLKVFILFPRFLQTIYSFIPS